jgi:hypothetical protein
LKRTGVIEICHSSPLKKKFNAPDDMVFPLQS